MSYSLRIRRFLGAPWPNKVHGLRYRFKRAWSKLLPSVPLPVWLPYGGWWMAGDDVCGDAVFSGSFEVSERRFVQGFLKPGMTVVDIGAHHGFYTMLAAKMVGPTGRVMSFEPSPRERERLLVHLRLNRILDRVSVFPIALGREAAESTLYVVVGRDTGCNSLRSPAVTEPTQTVQVSVTSLDTFLAHQNVARVDFIKMDVEGAELGVLEGAEELLGRRQRPVILTELADSRTLRWGYNASAIYDSLAAKGYRWFAITQEGKLRACPRTDQFGTNLVAFPDERVDEANAFQ
jgi:FkbM family methyltransferase